MRSPLNRAANRASASLTAKGTIRPGEPLDQRDATPHDNLHPQVQHIVQLHAGHD
jgi:hypothetical protein